MPMNDGITRDEALLALNDHLTREVEVLVHAELNELNVLTGRPSEAMVMSARGELRHWGGRAGFPDEDLAGLYDVAGASFDVTELDGGRYLADPDEPPYGIAFDLGPGVRLTVVWGPEGGGS